MPSIRVKTVTKRGCGFPKPGGFYLTTEKTPGRGCGKLPIALTPCPCCGLKIEQSRSMSLIPPNIISEALCTASRQRCGGRFPCPLSNPEADDKFALFWVGKAYYTAESFRKEVGEMGLSKRLPTGKNGLPLIPKGFKLGRDFLCLAHPEGVDLVNDETKETEKHPAIFMIVKPKAIEYAVKGDEPEAYLDILEEQGFELIRYKHKGEQGKQASLFDLEGGEETLERLARDRQKASFDFIKTTPFFASLDTLVNSTNFTEKTIISKMLEEFPGLRKSLGILEDSVRYMISNR